MEEKIYNIISVNLIRLRKINRYPQSDIADILHISQPAYNHMETGRSRIAAHQLLILACFYQISLNDFFRTKKGSLSSLENWIEEYLATIRS